MWSFQGMRICPAPSIPWFPILLCLWLSPLELSLFHISMSVVVILFQVMFRRSCTWEFMSVICNISRRHTLTANFSFLWLLRSYPPPQWSLRLGSCEMCCKCKCKSYWNWAMQLCVLICCDFLHWSPSVTKRRFLDKESEQVSIELKLAREVRNWLYQSTKPVFPPEGMWSKLRGRS